MRVIVLILILAESFEFVAVTVCSSAGIGLERPEWGPSRSAWELRTRNELLP